MKAYNPVRSRAGRIIRRLHEQYPEPKCALEYDNPFQLLVATILSAQCTDARVNLTTPALFARYPNAFAFATAEAKELQQLIKSTGFFRNKARNIIRCSQELVARHAGHVPSTMEELYSLPGIGRKTANVILGNAFATPSLPVDTHVKRLSFRLGLTVNRDPVKIERDLMLLIPRKHWTFFSHALILHGRQVCRARSPACDRCALLRLCPRLGLEKKGRSPLTQQRRGPAPRSRDE